MKTIINLVASTLIFWFWLWLLRNSFPFPFYGRLCLKKEIQPQLQSVPTNTSIVLKMVDNVQPKNSTQMCAREEPLEWLKNHIGGRKAGLWAVKLIPWMV